MIRCFRNSCVIHKNSDFSTSLPASKMPCESHCLCSATLSKRCLFHPFQMMFAEDHLKRSDQSEFNSGSDHSIQRVLLIFLDGKI